MTDFFDWLTATDSGLAVDRLADSFNLSQQEMRRTADALAPAFALALERAVADPEVWREVSKRFLPLAGSGTPVGSVMAQSDAAKELLSILFGSSRNAAAVARRASLAGGVAPDTVQMLMRSLSVMTMETMVRMMLANLSRMQPAGFADGNIPDALAEMMRRGANAVEALGRPSDLRRTAGGGLNPVADTQYLSRLFSNALNGMLPFMPPHASGTSAAEPPTPDRAATRRTERATTPETPFDLFLTQFGSGISGQTAHPGKPADERLDRAQAETNEHHTPAAGGNFDDLARAGQAIQDEYVRQMNEFFKLYSSGASQRLDDD